jgi:glycosyltransferase involved in cell wall biosynthesis
VPAEDPAALAAALERLLADPVGAFRVGQAARRHAERRFAPERHLEQLERHYRGDPTHASQVG